MFVFEEALQFPLCMLRLLVFEPVVDALHGPLWERTSAHIFRFQTLHSLAKRPVQTWAGCAAQPGPAEEQDSSRRPPAPCVVSCEASFFRCCNAQLAIAMKNS